MLLSTTTSWSSNFSPANGCYLTIHAKFTRYPKSECNCKRPASWSIRPIDFHATFLRNGREISVDTFSGTHIVFVCHQWFEMNLSDSISLWQPTPIPLHPSIHPPTKFQRFIKYNWEIHMVDKFIWNGGRRFSSNSECRLHRRVVICMTNSGIVHESVPSSISFCHSVENKFRFHANQAVYLFLKR